jgi:hypothetical protein
MSSPGAERSIAALAFEKYEDLLSGPIEAIVSTCGSEAGNSSGLPPANSLPAAATGMIPRATASSRGICSGESTGPLYGGKVKTRVYD